METAERRCFKCKKRLIGGEKLVCPRCFYLGHKAVRYVERHPMETTAALAVAVTRTRKFTVVSKAIVQLTKFM